MARDSHHSMDDEGLEPPYDGSKGLGTKVKAHDEVFGAIRDGGPDYRNVSWCSEAVGLVIREVPNGRSAGLVLPS